MQGGSFILHNYVDLNIYMSDNNFTFDCRKNISSRGRPGRSMCLISLTQKDNKRQNTSTNNTQQSTAMRYAEYIRMYSKTQIVNNNGG
jgi:hypothetical protein